MESSKVLLLVSLLFYFTPRLNALDTISAGQSLKGSETLISQSGTFEAGFFSFGDSNSFLYFGVWYKNISPRTVVWVANRDTPLGNSSCVLQLKNGRKLVILDSIGATIWSSNLSATAKKPVVQLLQSGNLVVKEANSSAAANFLWQSFDYPGDTLLPGMRLRSSKVSGQNTSLTSWRNTQDPAIGPYSFFIDTHGLPQAVITYGRTLLFRAGSWNGYFFAGIPSQTLNKYFNFTGIVLTGTNVSYGYELLSSSIISRFILTSTGIVQSFLWSDQTESWQLLLAGPVDQCDNYAICGANANCDVNNTPFCDCLHGFIPKSLEKWNSLNWSGGCVRRTKLECDSRDGFLKVPSVKLPNTSHSWFNVKMNLKQCENMCLKNCSCTAYANLDIRDGGSGCLLWFSDIVDMRTLPSGAQDLYVKVAASELGHKGNKKLLAGILAGSISLILVIILIGVVILWWRMKLKKKDKNKTKIWSHTDVRENEDIDIPIFDFSTIAKATNHFSISNKLGEGGFGPVYKGTLTNGQDIAVKRLSNNSGQGSEEFLNEVALIANLQHRNLVKLIGCCIQDDERLLIYEFMINRSLDNIIFDQIKSSLLHWTQRFQIISGIARGVLYLHEDSRLRIVHRDLKTSNILLDEHMNPKISDFGLARIFGVDEAEGKTKRVVGTFGYISPECIRGSFSVKSDVFSFGVIVLEIICGKKNMEFFHNYNLDLLCYAWRVWSEEKPLELIDESLGDSMALSEVFRCIHIGLLCVQERPEDRPDMSGVVLMLNGEKSLPIPKEPAFYPQQFGSSSNNYELGSTNEISVTQLDAR